MIYASQGIVIQLTYKESQDQLELFLASVRSRVGYNNNPSAKQFVFTFKRLLIRHEFKHVNTNCLVGDDTSILNVTSDVALFPTEHENSSLGLMSWKDIEQDHNSALISFTSMPQVVEDVIE